MKTKHQTLSHAARKAKQARWRRRENWMAGFASATAGKGRLFR